MTTVVAGWSSANWGGAPLVQDDHFTIDRTWRLHQRRRGYRPSAASRSGSGSCGPPTASSGWTVTRLGRRDHGDKAPAEGEALQINREALRHCTVFSQARSDRPDHECQDAGKKAIPEHAVFAEAGRERQEGDEETGRPE
jgi:hypothetical protein